MEIYENVPKKFLPMFPRTEPVLVDHTALIAAKHCPRKYLYKIVLGRVPNNTPPYFTFGGAYHKFREILEIEFNKLSEAEKKDTNVLVDKCCATAINVAVDYFIRHSSPEGVANTKWDWLTRERLIQCCVQIAFPYWINEKRTGAIEVLHTEQSINCQLSDGSFRSGRADQVVRWHGDVWGRDFKTSNKTDNFYERTTNPNDQFIGYTLIESRVHGVAVKGQLIEVLFNPKGKTPYIKPYPVSFSKWQLEEFEKDCVTWNAMIKKWREEDNYPMTQFNCSYCEYHQVCDKPSEQAIEYMLKGEYQFKPWDSTTVHND